MTSHLQSLWAGFQEFLEHRVLVVWIGTELRLKELKDKIKVHNLHLEQIVPLNGIIVTNCIQQLNLAVHLDQMNGTPYCIQKNLVVHLDQLHLLLSQFPSAVVDPLPFKTIINEIFFTLANRNIAKPVPSVSKHYKSSIPLY